MSLVSVILPVYNRDEVILNAINSVINQSYQNWELIIIDDCSTKDLKKIISQIKDPRIFFYRLNVNSGAAAARNYGIKKSKGVIICFLDSDDFFEPGFLETSAMQLRETPTKVGFMWTGVRYHLSSKTQEFSWSPEVKENSYFTFLNNLQIGTGAGVSVKRNVFEKCGYFDEDLPAAEDTEFFLRITQNFDFTYTTDVLINIVKNSEDRMSKNFRNLAIAYNRFLPIHFKEIDKYPILQEKYYYKMMWLNYSLKNRTKARYFYQQIPIVSRKSNFKISLVKNIYELLPLNIASTIHKKLTLF